MQRSVRLAVKSVVCQGYRSLVLSRSVEGRDQHLAQPRRYSDDSYLKVSIPVHKSKLPGWHQGNYAEVNIDILHRKKSS